MDRLGSGEWERLKAVRIRGLVDEPDAFGSSIEREGAFGEADWRRLIGLGPWWVAVAGSEDVGLVAGGTTKDPSIRWVYSMWVDERFRGTGVAAQLLDEVVRWARAEGAVRLGLDVTDRVPRARRFYERLGFVGMGTAGPLPRDPTIELSEMVLDLTSTRAGT
ncbi:MAG TPA: GNAT family N-acetyltransferase [Acidimicrobiales bacterium]|jgi:GNAT superfamily N-acetyltransferase